MPANTAALYCRLSTEDEDKLKKGDESESIRNQKLLLVDYALEHGFTVYKIYADEDFSGLSHDRPAFNEMLVHAEEGCFDTIICKTQSRFTRDMEQVEKYIHNKFPLWGIRFLTVIDQVDSSLKGNKKARQIYGLINEWFCEDLSDNIRAVFRAKMESGQFIGSFACYGYQKDPMDRHKLVIDKAAAEVVREIFSLYLGGKSCKAIAEILSGRFIKTPTEYKASQGNYKNPFADGLWSQNTVRKILQTQTYLGHLVQGKETKISYKSKKILSKPQNEWIIAENTHEAIIDLDSFQQVQALLRAHRKEARKSLNISNALDAKLFCGDCGARLQRGSVSRDKSTYYLRCAAHHRSGQKLCSKHSVRLDICIEAVRSALNARFESFLQDEENIRKIYERLKNFEKATGNESGDKRIINEQNKIIRTLYLDKAKGIITEEEFLDIKKSCLARIDECLRRQQKEQRLTCLGEDSIMELSVIHVLNPKLVNSCIKKADISEEPQSGLKTLSIYYTGDRKHN